MDEIKEISREAQLKMFTAGKYKKEVAVLGNMLDTIVHHVRLIKGFMESEPNGVEESALEHLKWAEEMLRDVRPIIIFKVKAASQSREHIRTLQYAFSGGRKASHLPKETQYLKASQLIKETRIPQASQDL